MTNIVQHKRGTTVPIAGDLSVGELGINMTSQKIYTKNSGGTIIELSPTEPAGSDTEIQYNNSGALGADSSFTFDLATQTVTVSNLVVTTQADLGSNTSVLISGGAAGEILASDGSGGLNWVPAGGTGTVTSVATAGSGLGFSLSGGAITTTGTVTLTVPSDTDLRTSLNIGNVANTNYPADGNVSNVLSGGGTWVALPLGTVTSVATANGTNATALGLGISGGAITSSGTITFETPDATNFRTNLGLGNLAVLNRDGNASNILYGNGAFAAKVGPAGSNTHVQFNDNGAFGGQAGFTFDKTSNALALDGTVTATGNVSGGNIKTTGKLISTVADGTVPLSVDSTTRVPNLSVAYSNVTDFSVVTGTSAGTWYPTLVTSTLTGNYALNANNTVSLDAATGAWNATLLGGTLTTVAQPNITSVGTLSSLAVTGNIQSGANIIGNLIVSRTGPVEIKSTGTSHITLVSAGNVALAPQTYITGVNDPFNPQDAATKNYVDAVAQGLKPKASVQAATTADITLSGAQTVDGVTLTNGVSRVLVKNQSTQADNGVYVYNSGGAWSRATDYDSASEAADGSFIFVDPGGTVNGSSGFVQISTVTVLGTDAIVYAQFSTGGSYTAGTGLTLGGSGSQFRISDTAVTTGSYGNATHVGSFTVNQQGQLTAASTVAITANAETLEGATLKSTVVNSSLTSVGTLSTLAVSGTSNLNAVGNVIITGGSAGQVLSTDGASPPTLSWTSVGTVTSVATSNSGDNLGFDLTGGPITTTGTVTLATPTVADLRTTLGLGDVANLNLNSNGSTFLAGNGSWLNPVAGSNTQIQFNQNGVLGAGGGLRYDYANLEFFAANSNLFGITKVDALRVSTTANLGANGNITITGSTTAGHLLINNGSNGVNWGFTESIANGTSNVRIDAVNGNILIGANGQSNIVVITSTGTVATTGISGNANVTGNLSTTGLVDIRWGTEGILIFNTAPTPTYNIDVALNSINYSTLNATGNVTLNIRGTPTVTANSIIANSQSLTTTLIMTTGATAYGVTAVQVDGAAQTIRWSGGAAPTQSTSSIMAYTFTIIKTSTTPTYTVLGTGTRYA